MNRTNDSTRDALRFYAFILRFYPAQYRQAFGPQMLQTFKDWYHEVLAQQGHVGIIFWLAVLADEARSIVREYFASWRKGSSPMEKLSKRKWQFLIGAALGLVIILAPFVFGRIVAATSLVLFGLILLVAIGLPFGVLVFAGAAQPSGQRPVTRPRWEVLTRYWGFAGGVATAGLVLLLGTVGVNLYNSSSSLCSGVPSTAPYRQAYPPKVLVTSKDYLTLGDYDFDQGNCTRALADYSQAIALDPTNAQALNNRGYTNMAIRNYAAALPDLDRAIELRPDYVNALMNRGDIYNYYYNIDDGRALADYDRVLALGPTIYRPTQLCGHRMLALNHGLTLGFFWEVATHGANAGCPPLASQ